MLDSILSGVPPESTAGRAELRLAGQGPSAVDGSADVPWVLGTTRGGEAGPILLDGLPGPSSQRQGAGTAGQRYPS